MAEGAGFELLLGAFAKSSDDQQKNHGEMLDALSPRLPIHNSVFGVVVTTAASPVLVAPSGVTGPAAGRIWNLRTLGIYGADGHSVVAGVTGVDLFAGDIPDQPGTAIAPMLTSFTDLISAGIVALPTFQTFPRHAIWVKHGEIPYALVYGVGAGVTLVLVANFEDWAVCDAEALRV